MKRDARKLPWAGFNKLRDGRIHVFCPRCHRKFSNSERGKLDPPRATLVVTHCPRCGQGGKESMEWFYDARGRKIPWAEIERHIDKMCAAERG